MRHIEIGLLTEAQFLKDCGMALGVFALKIVQKFLSLGDHFQKADFGAIILAMLLEMLS